MKRKTFTLLISICAVIMTASLFIIILNEVKIYESQKVFKSMKQENNFWENEDIKGWINIKGTCIDYPLMKNENDGQYYLHRNIYGESDYRGCLFIDIKCSFEDSANVIVYGHNMLDKTMFSQLILFENERFKDKHSEIVINVRNEKDKRVYAVFAAAKININDYKWIYDYAGSIRGNVKAYREYIKNIKECALYYSDINEKEINQLLLLSTCSYHEKNGRFVLLSVRVK